MMEEGDDEVLAISNLSVQVFTTPSLAQELISKHNAVQVIMKSLNEVRV